MKIKTERTLYVQNIHLHIYIVKFDSNLCLSRSDFPGVKSFKSDYALLPLLNFFSNLTSLIFPHKFPVLKAGEGT